MSSAILLFLKSKREHCKHLTLEGKSGPFESSLQLTRRSGRFDLFDPISIVPVILKQSTLLPTDAACLHTITHGQIALTSDLSVLLVF